MGLKTLENGLGGVGEEVEFGLWHEEGEGGVDFAEVHKCFSDL